MTQPGYTAAQTQSLMENADRLGLVWKKRPATISAPPSDDPTGVTAIMDGDTVPINVYSLIGVPPVGARVMCDIVPPSGIYVTGYIGPTPGTVLGGILFQTVQTHMAGIVAEVAVTHYSITIDEPANRVLKLEATFQYNTTVNNDYFIFKIRRDNVSGAVVGQNLFTVPTNFFAFESSVEATIESTLGTHTYVMTAARINGIGSISITTNTPNSFIAYDMGSMSNVVIV